ncbi:hypothetical protein [Frigoribacterium sp. VKM Ac-2530]|uniref:hypothetical protein n=1 Tax=Frigoribacterium sp. VKM Ac-2530 TaxID=2783822 RepID=UPI00188D7301|nr:hypothetical protein [Frigoribacterium sp. VKM Ac-2530]MBF4578967.1 hypothetical protein [Frigoribacterium sp. VKM Ac-2530]
MATTPEPTKGVPLIAGNPSPTIRADHNKLGEWVRDEVESAVATVDDLPASGNWLGRRRFVSADARPYVWRSTTKGWMPESAPVQVLQMPPGRTAPPADAVIYEKIQFFTGLRTNEFGVLNAPFRFPFRGGLLYASAQTLEGSAKNPVINKSNYTGDYVEWAWPGEPAIVPLFLVRALGWD